jgi:ferulate-5-hydroxylase
MAAMAKISMEWPNDLVSWVFLASLVVVLLQLRQRSKLPLPPGPKPLPIIGNMMLMGQLTHRRLAVLAERYGGLLHLSVGRRHVFVVSTAEYAGQVLQAQDAAFANRPATTAIAYLTDGHADMAFAQYGPFWRQARKLSVTKLFSRRRAETWLAVRDESEALVRAVARRSGETVNLGELVLSLSTNVIFRAAFGTRVNISLGEYIGVLEEFSRNISAFNIGDFMPWLAWIDPSRRRLRETRKGFDRFIDKIIDDHIRRGRSSTDAEADIIDEMLACLHETKPIAGDAVDDRHGSLCLTRRNIKAVILVRARIVCRASISDPAFILLEMNFTYVLMCHVCMDRTTSHARRISCLVGRRRWRRPSSGR